MVTKGHSHLAQLRWDVLNTFVILHEMNLNTIEIHSTRQTRNKTTTDAAGGLTKILQMKRVGYYLDTTRFNEPFFRQENLESSNEVNDLGLEIFLSIVSV